MWEWLVNFLDRIIFLVKPRRDLFGREREWREGKGKEREGREWEYLKSQMVRSMFMVFHSATAKGNM